MSARNLWSFACGVLFSLGVVVSGMVRPSKVLGFLNPVAGWDPSLAFVMVGAIGVFAIAWRLAARRRAPVFASVDGEFPAPAPKHIDARLVGGAALFGVGWGLAGYCPGPAVAAIGTGAPDALLFTAAMLGGMKLFELLLGEQKDEASAPAAAAVASDAPAAQPIT